VAEPEDGRFGPAQLEQGDAAPWADGIGELSEQLAEVYYVAESERADRTIEVGGPERCSKCVREYKGCRCRARFSAPRDPCIDPMGRSCLGLSEHPWRQVEANWPVALTGQLVAEVTSTASDIEDD
jgi:hypothetical protein